MAVRKFTNIFNGRFTWYIFPRLLHGLTDSGCSQMSTVRSWAPRSLDHVLWDRNPGFLKSEIGPFSDFKRKSYLMDLKSAHSQESDFQESGEVDRFLKMGTHFQERSGSLENGLCVTWSGFWVCPGHLWLLILVAVEQIYDQITRRLVAQRVALATWVIWVNLQAFGDGGYWWKRWRTGSRYRCRCHDAVICLYSRDLARWYQQGPHSSKNLSSRKCTPNDIPRRVGPREEIQWVDFT